MWTDLCNGLNKSTLSVLSLCFSLLSLVASLTTGSKQCVVQAQCALCACGNTGGFMWLPGLPAYSGPVLGSSCLWLTWQCSGSGRLGLLSWGPNGRTQAHKAPSRVHKLQGAQASTRLCRVVSVALICLFFCVFIYLRLIPGPSYSLVPPPSRFTILWFSFSFNCPTALHTVLLSCMWFCVRIPEHM